MNPINSQIWEKYSAPAIKSDRNTKITFVKYRFANLVEKKKREEFKKARKRTRTSSKCPFSHLLSTNKISYSQKAESIIEKKEGELMIFVTLGVFSKIQKSLRAKKNISQKYVKYEN